MGSRNFTLEHRHYLKNKDTCESNGDDLWCHVPALKRHNKNREMTLCSAKRSGNSFPLYKLFMASWEKRPWRQIDLAACSHDAQLKLYRCFIKCHWFHSNFVTDSFKVAKHDKTCFSNQLFGFHQWWNGMKYKYFKCMWLTAVSLKVLK